MYSAHFDLGIWCFCAKYRTITFSNLIKLVSLLFTPVYYLPAKPISHQLSQRECFYLLVSLIFLTPKSLLHRRFLPFSFN